MTALSNALIVPLDDLEDADIATLREAITETLASFNTAPISPDAILGWTEQTARELYDRLIDGNRAVQAQVIAYAAHNGGVCDRDTVYALGGYPEDRVLKGFTRPVARIMRDLASEGLIPLDAATPMATAYDATNASFQKAQGFRMPDELTAVFAAAVPAPKVPGVK